MLFCLLAGLNGCSSDAASSADGCPGNDQIDRSGRLSVREISGVAAKSLYGVDASALGIGASKAFEFRIGNEASVTTGQPLRVVGLTLTETDSAGKPVTDRQFSCEGPGGKPCDTAVWPEVIPAGWDSTCAAKGAVAEAPLVIRYTKSAADATSRKLRVEVSVQGDVEADKEPTVLVFQATLGSAKLSCKPATIDFGAVAVGLAREETLTCANSGTAPVQLQRIELFGTMPVSLDLSGTIASAGSPFVGSPPLQIAAGKALTIPVRLAPLAQALPTKSLIRIDSDDPAQPRIDIDVVVNTTGPCLKATPAIVNFGVQPVGLDATEEISLYSCGTEPVSITEIAVASGADVGFGLQLTTSCLGGTSPTAAAPLVLAPGASCTFFATYSAPQLGAVSTGSIRIATPTAKVEVELQGQGADAVQCPVACFQVKTKGGTAITDAVVPQTTLQLDASCSTPGGGSDKVTQYKWKLSQPAGSYAFLQPSGQVKAPSFTPNIAGTYVAELEVTDSLGQASCAPYKLEILVIPDDKLHVELVWTTPGDADPSDEGDSAGKLPSGVFAGSDMDLHLAHPDAIDVPGQKDIDKNGEPDPWNAPCQDCFVFNTKPSWGDLSDEADDARLDRDDKDGWGPENINVAVPEEGLWYHLGVHYWAANGFGKSTPTLRIYLGGSATPTYVLAGPDMSQGEMWCAGTVSWPPSGLKPCKGADTNGNLLTKGYPLPSAPVLNCQ